MLQRRADKEHGQLSSFVILYSIVNMSCTYVDVFSLFTVFMDIVLNETLLVLLCNTVNNITSFIIYA